MQSLQPKGESERLSPFVGLPSLTRAPGLHETKKVAERAGLPMPGAPFLRRSCEKTCLVRFPAIWGWSEMSIRLSKIALRASIEEIPKREKLQNREGGFFTASPDVSAT